MVTINNLSKSYGKRTLFSNVSLRINRGEKIGLIGPNGAGKTTLFSLILGVIEPSVGYAQVERPARVGYLAQESQFKSGRTVLEELVEGDELIVSLNKERRQLEFANQAGSSRYGEVLHQLEVSGYFELEYKAKKILAGLGFKETDFSRPISELSGGWQMRVLLAKLLTCPYDLLLLDEPTNYLDLEAALWFKDYLSSFKGTFVMISHDKSFLDEVTNYTLILENASISKVKGNYEHFIKIQDEKRSHLLKLFKEQEKKKEQLKKFVSRFHAQPNKAAQVRAKRRVLEKMQDILVPADRRDSIRKFHFPQSSQSGYQVVTLKDISKSYGDIHVYKDFNFEIIRGEKAVLAGENGAGKSTLLKILAGMVDVNSGRRQLGYNVSIGYFSQTRMDVLTPYNTVLEEACACAANMTAEGVRTILGAFLFTGDDVDKKVSVLSGGEKSRLILAKLLINPPNFLLLDEPTTHLDVDAVEALIKALKEFEGTLVFISHDVYFVRSVANYVYDVKQGRVRKFAGNFDYYLSRRNSGQLYVEDTLLEKENFKKDEKEKDKLTEGEIEEHNNQLAKRIRRLRRRKENFELDRYSVSRIIDNPRHSKDVIKDYKNKLEKIEEKIEKVEEQIKKVKRDFL